MRWFENSWIRIAAVVATAGFVACEDKDGPTDVPEEEAAKTVSDTVCEQAQGCGCFELVPGDVDQCRTEGQSEWQLYLDAGAAEGLTYDGTCIGRILDLYGEFGCKLETDLTEEDFADFETCSQCKFFHGDVQVGQPCQRPQNELLEYTADECAQGLYCTGEICVDPCDEAGEGEDCIVANCAEGLYCDYTVTGGPDGETEETAVCVREAQQGEPCDEASCAEGLYCSYEIDGQSSTCLQLAQEGEDCTQAQCDYELQCDLETNTCRPQPGPGEPCPNGSCQDDSYCDSSLDADSSTWTCVARKGEGEPCEESQECLSWECEAGACLAVLPIVCYGATVTG